MDAWGQQVAALSGGPPRAGSSGPDQALPGGGRVDPLRSLNHTADNRHCGSRRLSATICTEEEEGRLVTRGASLSGSGGSVEAGAQVFTSSP